MRRLVLAAASVLVLGSIAAGCGGGGGSATSAPATAPKGGETSVEGFGSEAKGTSRAALLGAFTGYLESIAAEDAAKACARLSAAVKRSLSELSANGPRKGEGCAMALPELLAPAAPAIARQQADGEVAKVRVKGDRAFVVFHAPGAKLYQLTLVREGGGWKAATAVASVLVPSAATLR